MPENSSHSDDAGASAAPHRDDHDHARYEGFVRLLVENEARVRSFLRGLLPTWYDVEEVMQEASLVAWRKFSQFEPGTSFGGWLMTIARFEALKHRRKAARTPLVFSDDLWELLAAEAADDVASSEPNAHTAMHEALEGCLDKVAPAQRELLLRAHAPGVRMSDVALQTGRSEQGFYKMMQRLRASLLECITKELTSEGLA